MVDNDEEEEFRIETSIPSLAIKQRSRKTFTRRQAISERSRIEKIIRRKARKQKALPKTFITKGIRFKVVKA